MTIEQQQTIANSKIKRHLIGLQTGKDIVAIMREIERERLEEIERKGRAVLERMGRTLAELDPAPDSTIPATRPTLTHSERKAKQRRALDSGREIVVPGAFSVRKAS